MHAMVAHYGPMIMHRTFARVTCVNSQNIMSTTTDFQVPKRPIGSQGLVVSVQGLGTNKMSSPAAPEDEEAFLNTVARGLELGINFIDTAWLYGVCSNA